MIIVVSSRGGGEDVSQPGICQGGPYLGPVKMFPHSKEEEMSPNLGSVSGSPYLELVCGLGGGCCQGCEAWQPVVRGGDQVTRACVPVVLTAIFSLFFPNFFNKFLQTSLRDWYSRYTRPPRRNLYNVWELGLA